MVAALRRHRPPVPLEELHDDVPRPRRRRRTGPPRHRDQPQYDGSDHQHPAPSTHRYARVLTHASMATPNRCGASILRVMTFSGFPKAALDFYDDLELDNTKSFWTAHKETYETAVKAPMLALTAALEEEFGPAKVFRPYRDVRFAKDKTPYKDHQGAYVAVAPSTGWYVQLSAGGVYVGAGFYEAASDRLARVRAAIAEDHAQGVRRRPSAHRPAPPQVDDAGEVLRLRRGDPHPEGAHHGARRLARCPALRGVGQPARLRPTAARFPRARGDRHRDVGRIG